MSIKSKLKLPREISFHIPFSSESKFQKLGFIALFSTTLTIGLIAHFNSNPALSWRDVDNHYAQGPDLTDTQYSKDLCGAIRSMLNLNPNAYAVWDSPIRRRDRLPLQPEYDRHCKGKNESVIASPSTQSDFQNDTAPEPSLTTYQSELTGNISIDGSSTVFPITEAMAGEFGIIHSQVNVTVGVSGTGGGFERFCRNEIDISNASRPIDNEEIELCAENGVEFIEIPVAYDGLTVIVHKENDWVDQLTISELNHIFRPDNYAIYWSEVRKGFPDTDIYLFAPGADSGTFDYFTETINEETGAHRFIKDIVFSENDNIIVQGVSGTQGSIGYLGFSYYTNNASHIKAVPIVNDIEQAVTPSLETINDGSYNPLSRPLLIYIKASSLNEPQIAAFVEYYLTEGNKLIEDPGVGYIRLPDNIYAFALKRVQDRKTGSAIAQALEDQSLESIFGVE